MTARPGGHEGRKENEMRYIDRSNCTSISQKGKDNNVARMGELTREATKKAERLGLGLLKNRQGTYRVIRECGLGAYEEFFTSLAEVDKFLKKI